MPDTPPPANASSLRSISLEQRLPKLRRSLRETKPTEALALVSTLFAGVQAQLLSNIPDEPSPKISQSFINALHIFSYGGLAINIGAALPAIVSILLVHGIDLEQGLSALVESQQDIAEVSNSNEERTPAQPSSIQRRLSSSGRLEFECLLMTLFGTYTIFVQISLLAWAKTAQHGSTVVFALIVVVNFIAIRPLTLLVRFKGYFGLRSKVGE